MVEVTAVAQEIIDKVEKLSVLELNGLVKALEEKFGVTAAAPVAVAVAPAAGGAAGGADAGAASTVSVILTSAGDKKINVLKAVREITGLGLKEAKDLVDGAPKPVKENIGAEEAKTIKEKLEKEGAKVEIK
ncbi:50S ribosomal protein L7/L12 [Candidatus Termititenax persephonae]|uniref:Large ribosomal subunit protein bL12 n=1 Tax=Candidatus Termititenax persephonae TaxID=2218525 RepID=A0A388TFC7_9BACT|nr:50S ribosomal protein L7/L12 [Candidatus Termititenax persephonae]